MARFKYIKKVRTSSGKWRYIYASRNSTSPPDIVGNTIINQANEEARRRQKQKVMWDNSVKTAKDIYKFAKDAYGTWSRWSEGNRKTAAKVIKKVAEYASDTYKQYSEQKRRDEAKQTDSNRQSFRSTRSRRRNPSGRSATVHVRKRKTLENPFR